VSDEKEELCILVSEEDLEHGANVVEQGMEEDADPREMALVLFMTMTDSYLDGRCHFHVVQDDDGEKRLSPKMQFVETEEEGVKRLRIENPDTLH